MGISQANFEIKTNTSSEISQANFQIKTNTSSEISQRLRAMMQ